MNPCEHMDGLDMDLAHAAEEIESLRAAIEQYEAAEPFAWRYYQQGFWHFTDEKREWYNGVNVEEVIPLYTHHAPAVPEGWQLVPKEPTEEMRNAFANGTIGFDRLTSNAYRAMLSAAPKP